MGRNIREIPPRRNSRANIIACDFDGTLCEHKYPSIGEPFVDIINDLIYFRKLGGKLVLWTCRGGKYLQEAVEWCKEYGLEFDAVNEDVEDVKKTYIGEKSCKVCADFYFDDRNL